MPRLLLIVSVLALADVGSVDPAIAQQADLRGPTELDVAGLPSLSFDADEGFGYGAQMEVYRHRSGVEGLYLWTVQPKVFFTTRGRRDVTLFFDAPGLAEGWRFDAFVGDEERSFAPFYGLGNETMFDRSLEDDAGPNPNYYAYARARRSVVANVQRRVGDGPVRGLFGAGVARTRVDPVSDGTGTSVYSQQVGSAPDSYWTAFVRAGLIWDTRDRETAPRRGTWTEVVVQRVDERLGADVDFWRWTFVDRRYWSVSDRLVVAHRWLVQDVRGDAPIDHLQRVETSFKDAEGLGGSRTVRGLPKNRLTGRGMFVWNAELRWRAAEFQAFGRPVHVTLSGFVDQGRVWLGGVRPGELFQDLHRGFGGGVHVGTGEYFVVSLDAATSRETGMPFYIGLGYLY